MKLADSLLCTLKQAITHQNAITYITAYLDIILNHVKLNYLPACFLHLLK